MNIEVKLDAANVAALERLIKAEKDKDIAKKIYEEYSAALEAVATTLGTNIAFQDADGTVYKLLVPQGRYVQFDRFATDRTRRVGEAKGSLSMEEAKRYGFTLPEAVTAKQVKPVVSPAK